MAAIFEVLEEVLKYAPDPGAGDHPLSSVVLFGLKPSEERADGFQAGQ